MSRTITIALPPEPAAGSVTLVELVMARADETERRAFQRLDDGIRPTWRMVGGDWSRGWSWAEVLAAADGRPVLVLWEPS
jgi:hypothetical protein